MNYATPEKTGIKSSHILDYLKSIEAANLLTHNIIIMHKGCIVFENYREPFNKDFLHRMYSVTKSFIGLAIGFLEQDGLVDLDAPIIKYFPDEMKNQTDENMRKQTIRHMLMMATAKPNQNWFEAQCEDRVKFYFDNSLPDTRPSGTVFQYDSTGSFVLGALVERITGKELMEYLREKFLDKIGFSKEAYMLKCPGGHSWGDSALLCKATDLLKVAMFCMNKGEWNGEQLLNKEFVIKATTKQIDNNIRGLGYYDAFGYGYQLWMSRQNSFFFNGMGGQLALCIPDKELILVYNGDNQGHRFSKKIILDGFFDMIADRIENTLPENLTEYNMLCEYADALKLFSVKGDVHCNMQDKINGVEYELENNPMGISRMKLVFDGDKGIFSYTNEQDDKKIPFGMCSNEFAKFPQEGYSDTVGARKGNRLYDCAASAAWVSDYQLFIKVQIIDTYFGILNINFGFEDDKVGIFMNKIAEDFLNEYQGFAGGKATKI